MDDRRPPRVVMLVAHTVEGDSRVQKAARTLADTGWDVVLLGRAPGPARDEYALGHARVVRLPVRMTATQYRHEHPARGPLTVFGYRSGEAVRRRVDMRRALRADLEVERWLAERDGSVAARARFTGRAVADRARGYWIEVRKRLYERAAAKALEGAARRAGGPWLAQPQLADYDTAFAPVVAKLAPDVVHVHDIEVLGTAVRAAARARRAGRTVRVVYDAHRYVAGFDRAFDPTFRRVMTAQERRYLPLVDGVVTVSGEVAELLHADYGLSARPTVVRNLPLSAGRIPVGGGVRGACGLADDVPLLVYSGIVAPDRGLTTVVDGLKDLDGVHLALVTAPNGCVAELERRAEALGAGPRTHVLPYVDPVGLVAHLSTASVGLVPFLPSPNHELSLPSKYYEYANARLPMVVSDVRAAAAHTREHGIGEVFRAGDAPGFAHAVRRLLGARETYVQAYDGLTDAGPCTWEAEASALPALYAEVMGAPHAAAVPQPRSAGVAAESAGDAPRGCSRPG